MIFSISPDDIDIGSSPSYSTCAHFMLNISLTIGTMFVTLLTSEKLIFSTTSAIFSTYLNSSETFFEYILRNVPKENSTKKIKEWISSKIGYLLICRLH